jgi:uncharacterized metal-binding protein
MPSLPQPKVGIVACSGEELAVGTVTRLAALRVLHDLRPGRTVTICLPLFLAGGEGDRAFARFHPTITVDGCALRCAARGTERHSGPPTASIVVDALVAEHQLPTPEGRRHLNQAGLDAVELTARRLVELVDDVLRAGSPLGDAPDETVPLTRRKPPAATCSCGSATPVTKLIVDGTEVELLALPLIFRQFLEAGRRADDPAAAGDLFETVKLYNRIPPGAEDRCRDAVLGEYAAFCEREAAR